MLALTGAALAFVALDVTLHLVDRPTVGWAGPHANLALSLLVDVSLPFLVRWPRLVAGVTFGVAVALAIADAAAPGLLTPITSVSPSTVPRATPIVLIVFVRHEAREVGIGVVAAFALVAGRVWQPSWVTTPLGLLNTLVPGLGAMYLQARAQLLASLRERAEHAEWEREVVAEQVRADERRRLAEEMHDVVTHRLSLVILQAGAVRVSSDDAVVRDAADGIRASTRQALEELRELVGVLRDGRGPVASRPPRDDPRGDIEGLVAASRAGGIDVELDLRGSASLVSPAVDRTGHRIVQEALTNVHKHAPDAHVAATVTYTADGMRVAVVNDTGLRQAHPDLGGTGSGAGLQGLDQRVALIGGWMRAGPAADGGWAVVADLPAQVPTREAR